MPRYKFVNAPENIERLLNTGFETLTGIRHYYYINYKNEDARLTIHSLLIDKNTNLLKYTINSDISYDDINLDKIEPLIAKKITQLLDMKLLVITTEIYDDERVKYERKKNRK